MAGDYEKPITIEEAIRRIKERHYLLPAIQRKFIWSPSQICVLFDSIMRGHPINTFMFWKVTDSEIKKSLRFYQFLERYCEYFEENNKDFDIKGHGDFSAVIDGQQRLTSLYIGLKGTYAYKLPRKWRTRTRDDSVFPPRKLYLNLAAPLDEDDEESNEEMMRHEFKFLTDAQFEKDLGKKNKFWFAVGDILDFPTGEKNADVVSIVEGFLKKEWKSNEYARDTLIQLYFAMRLDSTIHFYHETTQSGERVLDIFIRTNRGGTPLKRADLVMSLAVAKWKEDMKQQIDELVEHIRPGSGTGFSIDRDFVLKTALMLTDEDTRLKVGNFTEDRVKKIEQEWDDIKACIVEVFRLIRSFGLHDAALSSKNAAIPIAYYLFHKGRNKMNGKQGLYADINNRARHEKERKRICQWLHLSLLKKAFGSSSDTMLKALWKIIRDGLKERPAGSFPLDEIITSYRGTKRDLTFDKDFIDRLLKTRKKDPSCFSILALLLPDLDFTQALEIDHLHPEVSFKKKNLDAYDARVGFGNPAGRSFYEDPENWDSIVNLHLLNSSKNRSKHDKPLDAWLAEQRGTKAEDLLIPVGTDLSFGAFESFIKARRELLKQRLSALVGATHSAAPPQE